ncbi:PhoH-like protein [uncultured Coprococcus sp.]|uniref:PhoH family protein n=1 Tax=Coprococcus ammoniilyticus TaxID=2981785 RepID=UPI0008231546|nr:PhoH family protein [Coprococcus ammoniilyticus]MCU6731139.1 PhoH family protein [Coprococcus ammoniilyticus]SCH95738.1 PhoH-like protein [uncultured Coprococcus sp.]
MVFIINKIYFYDTNALLELQNKIFDHEFIISSISLQELENIKVSRSKDDQVKYNARKILHLLDEKSDKYKVIIYDLLIETYISDKNMEITPDTKIVGTCSYIQDKISEEVIFVTNDIACKMIASKIFNLNVESVGENPDDKYSGCLEVTLSDEDMAYFYEHLQDNIYNLFENEYLILKNSENRIVDTLVWRDGTYQNIKFPNIKSDYFGIVKPLNGDVYQQMALNSFSNNQVTMIKGAAGTGKSYLAIGYMMWLLEKHKIDRIIIFCNTIATANSAKLGYYPGTKDEKLLDSSIGNMLSAKLGGLFGLERMINQELIQLLPLSDIRGFDTNGMRAGVYITEAQNMDISLMKLALQRIGEDSICIVDGDYNTQVDLSQYAGNNNGMRRMSEVFRGQDFYGEIELKNIYRSRIAAVAEEM